MDQEKHKMCKYMLFIVHSLNVMDYQLVTQHVL